jgi:hypothetical protein
VQLVQSTFSQKFINDVLMNINDVDGLIKVMVKYSTHYYIIAEMRGKLVLITFALYTVSKIID